MNEELSHRPTLSIITRCYKRPKLLKRCIASVKSQIDPDYEHLFIHDDLGRGLHWANRQIANYRDKCNGRYVYILDDDDFLTCKDFISELKTLLENLEKSPGIIFCKGYINNQITPKLWHQTPQRGQVGSPNFIVENKIFKTHAHRWDQANAGDFHFINHALKYTTTVFWWNKFIFEANSSAGFTEQEKARWVVA